MGNWLSTNRRTSTHYDLEVDAVRIPNESESHEPTIPKQLENSPAEFNEQNFLEETKQIMEIVKLSQEETNGHDSCQTYPKELETSFPTTHQPSPIFGASNDFYHNENIHTKRSNSDAANSVTSMNINGISINILGDNNVVNCHPIDHSIDLRSDHHRQSQPRNDWKPLSEKRVLKVKKGIVSPQTIFEVAENVGADWRKLGIHLNFSVNELDTLYHDHHFEGAVEICYRLLTSWRERLASEATYLVLGNALKKIGRHDVVKTLVTMSDD